MTLQLFSQLLMASMIPKKFQCCYVRGSVSPLWNRSLALLPPNAQSVGTWHNCLHHLQSQVLDAVYTDVVGFGLFRHALANQAWPDMLRVEPRRTFTSGLLDSRVISRGNDTSL